LIISLISSFFNVRLIFCGAGIVYFLNGYFGCYAQLQISAAIGGKLWENDFKELRKWVLTHRLNDDNTFEKCDRITMNDTITGLKEVTVDKLNSKLQKYKVLRVSHLPTSQEPIPSSIEITNNIEFIDIDKYNYLKKNDYTSYRQTDITPIKPGGKRKTRRRRRNKRRTNKKV
jgi:hypothetical protein